MEEALCVGLSKIQVYKKVLLPYFQSYLDKFKSSAGEKGRVNSRRHTSRPHSHEALLVKLLGHLTAVLRVYFSL